MPYIEKDLIKVEDPENAMKRGTTTYWAVDEDTADNMLNVDYGRMNDPLLQKITMSFLGTVRVEIKE